MARKTTTKAFRERAISMVLAGKTTEQVAAELGVEHHKVRRWFNNAVSNSACMNPGIFDIPASNTSSDKTSGEARTTVDKEKRRLGA
ncbi:helix-turn-helix domain-containing protein [Endozoicomonas gorgoniicola]|uniref:Helix-turn-helix domain-containing protein n=1 Tax=Endozoicomonas gorgoniicola TaxID=1234144 RepID=A0ABT3N2T0_9GAMM|nr:helix-turn-helix domain-containing protein [Endozoicomonas gorgoniicola]MCW7555926.1 helix-turn-helix domain-containing protein [Endozoicomonas gorgoniicola]